VTSGRVTSGRVTSEQSNSGRFQSRRVHVRPHGLLDVLRQGNLPALILPVVLLALGWGARTRLARKTVAFSWRGIELARPAGWTVAERSAEPAEGDTVVLMDLLGPGRIKPRVTLRIAPLPAMAPSEDSGAPAASAPAAPAAEMIVAAPVIAEALANRLPLYYSMGERPVQIGGLPATRVDSAFAFTPRAIPGRKGDIPVVMRAIDLVFLRGSDALSVQVAAPIEDFEAQRPTLEAIVASLRIDPAAANPAGTVAPAAEPAAAPSPVADGPGPGDVIVAGQVVDSDSGLAVPGAIVLFLAPGTGVDSVTDDNLTEVAFTTGLADSTGHFASNRALPRPANYGVMVVADGYRWIGTDDGVAIGAETPAHLDVGAVRLRRR
jgi:hypothetical protein